MAKRKLNIKNLVPRKDSPYRQGYYKIANVAKYIGDPNKIIFRSSWEKKFAMYCDNNERIIAWSSEPMQIPYLHPVLGEIKPYNIDFYVKLQVADDTYKDYLIEVKPSRQLKQPTAPKRNTAKSMEVYIEQMKTFAINLAKFDAAKKFAKSRGWEFLIVTEHTLGNL